jgi:hypothetical protein
MGYVHITIHLRGGGKRCGVRAFAEPMNLEDIRRHAWHLAAEVLGRNAIENVSAREVPADDPAVVALILGEQRKNKSTPRSTGEHPYIKQQQRRPPR